MGGAAARARVLMPGPTAQFTNRFHHLFRRVCGGFGRVGWSAASLGSIPHPYFTPF